jgi:hypothetical protein
MTPPSPRKHANAFAGFSSASLTTFLLVEAQTRLGLELTLSEAGFIVACATGLFLFLGKRVVPRAVKPEAD